MPQDIAIFEDISAEQNVSFFAGLYGNKGQQLKSLVNEALELVALSDKKNNKPKTFSGGMMNEGRIIAEGTKEELYGGKSHFKCIAG